MKKRFHSTAFAVITTITMLMQVFVPSVALAVETTEPSEPDVTVESTVVSESEETSGSVVIDETSETSSIGYVEETEDLSETQSTETDSDEEETISSATDSDPTDVIVEESAETESTEQTDEVAEVEETVETEETVEPEYEFSVTLPDDITISVDETVTISAVIVATETIGDVTTDLEYSFQFTGNGVTFSNAGATETEISFTEPDIYVVSGILNVDGVAVAVDDMVVTVTEPSTVEITTASDMDEFLTLVSQLPSSNRLIVSTATDISDTIENAVGVYFDGVYVISFEDNESYSNAISYFTEAGISYCIDGVVETTSISGESYITNAELNTEGEVRVAIIDTGSNLANESYSVIGGDTSDDNGHGTRMAELILDNDADNAYIISIKALGVDGHGSIVDVYNAVQLALELDVDYILMSFSTINSTDYSAFRDLLTEAHTNGINVVASAGNNGMNASFYVPASVSDVTTVGAMTEEYTKLPASNYGPCVDYYVIADSTSDAAAMYVGYTLSGAVENIFTAYLAEDAALTDSELYELYASLARDITADLVAEYGYGECRLVVNEFGEFSFEYVFEGVSSSDVVINARPDSELVDYSTNDIGPSPVNITDGMSGSDSGTATYSQGSYPGWGSISGISSTGATGSGLRLSDFASSMKISCSRAYDGEDSRHARPIANGATVYYQANYTVSNGRIVWTVLVSERSGDFSQPVWEDRSMNNTWRIVPQGGSSGVEYVAYVNGQGAGTASATESGAITTITQAVNDAIADIARAEANEFGSTRNLRTTGLPRGIGSGTAVSTWQVTVDPQIFEGTLQAGQPEEQHGYVLFNKVGPDQQPLNGAIIYFVCTDGPGVGHENTLYIYDTSKVSAYNTVSWNGHSGIQFTTNGNVVRIEGLAPNSTYVFHEYQAPINDITGESYELAVDMTVTTDADGNAPGGTIRMVDEYTMQGMLGSIGIYKTFDTNNLYADQLFWSNVDQIDFNFYAFNVGSYAEWDSYGYHSTSRPNWGDHQVTSGQFRRDVNGGLFSEDPVRYAEYAGEGDRQDWYYDPYPPYEPVYYWEHGTYYAYVHPPVDGDHFETGMEESVSRATSGAYVYWNAGDQSGNSALGNGAYANYGWYPGRWWLHYNGAGGWDNPSSVSDMSHLPRGIYVVTEEWDQGLWGQYGTGAAIENEYIHTMNSDPAWTRLSDENARHQVYALLCYVNEDGQTYILNWNNGSTIATFPRAIDTSVANPDPIYNYYGNYTAVNVENTGSLDVEKIDQSGLGVDDIHFEVWRGNTQFGYGTLSENPTGTRTNASGGSYNVYDVSWDYYTRINDHYNYMVNIGGSTAYWIPDGGDSGDAVWTESYTIILTDSGEVIQHWCNQDSLSSLNYGMYQIREYLPDTNSFAVPEGWQGADTDGDGDYEYFYQDVTVNSNHQSTPLSVEIANVVLGRIDVAKVSLTGGPLSDLSFEIRRNGTAVATGYISDNAAPETTGTGNPSDYTYSVTWDYDFNGHRFTNMPEAITGLGTFEVREYIPASALEYISDLSVSGGWRGPYQTSDGRYYYSQEVVIDDSNGEDLTGLTITNEVHPIIGTTLTDFADRHITVVGENIDFTDVVAYEGAYIGGSYIMHATLMDAASGQPLRDEDGNVYEADVPFTANAGSGTVNVTFTVNTAALVEATTDANGIVSYSPRSVVCFESMRLVNGYEIANHNDLTDEAQTITIDNPVVETTLTSVQNIRSHAPVGETVTFVDTVTYTNLHVGETYTVTAYIYDKSNGQRLVGPDGLPFTGSTTFTPMEESGTIEVPITINTASIIEAYVDGQGVIHEQTKDIVCYEYLYSESDILIGGHTDITDEGQTIEITPPEIGTTFTDLQTEEHETVSGRIVQVLDTVSYTGLHVGETYTLTCFLYDKTTGNQLVYSDGTLVIGTRTFEAETADGEIRVEFTIDTSDLLVNVFEREERTTVAFEYLRTEKGILIGGHTDINDLPQGITPRLPELRTSIVDDQTGTHTGRLGAEVPFTDTVWYNNLNVGETYEIRGRIIDRENPAIVYATAVQEFVAESRTGTVQVHFIVDTSEVCDGNREAYIVCFEQLWQLDTQNTGRGEVRIATHEDVTDQGQTIHLPPEIQTQMTDPVTGCNYGLIGENVEFIDTVSFHNLHIGETYTVSGVIMDKQTGEPVLDRNGQPYTASTTFVPETSDGTVDVVYHVDTLYLLSQIGQTVNGITVEAPREIVSFETITSTSGFDFEIHADIEDEGQTIILGDIRSGAGDTQTSTSWLAVGLTTIRDTVHYRGLGPVEYTVRGSLHLISYDENGNAIDGGLIQARPGEVTETEYTWTPTNHEGDINLDYTLNTDRFEGQNIIVFEELWYNGVCIISHEHYCDSNGNYGMDNLEQTVRRAEVHTNAFSYQTGAQMVAYDTEATITDSVYYGNVEVGQSYYVEGSLWGCYTDENGYIHSTPITQEEGGRSNSAVFTATESSGVVEVLFTINSTMLSDRGFDYVVVTERLIHVGSGVSIADHMDLTDQAQTIQVPNVHTTATTETGHTLPEGTNADIRPVTVTDRVYYENLIPGKSYTVVGNLQYARTDAEGNITESGALVQNGQPITATKTFVPEASTGYIDLEFTVNAADIMAHGYNRIVVFEDLYFGPEGIRVAVHADITDEEQTIFVPPTNTPTPTPTIPGTPPKTGDESGYGEAMFGAVVAVIILAAGVAALAILDRKKK